MGKSMNAAERLCGTAVLDKDSGSLLNAFCRRGGQPECTRCHSSATAIIGSSWVECGAMPMKKGLLDGRS